MLYKPDRAPAVLVTYDRGMPVEDEERLRRLAVILALSSRRPPIDIWRPSSIRRVIHRHSHRMAKRDPDWRRDIARPPLRFDTGKTIRMRALQRVLYIAAYTVAYLAAALALGFLVLVGWWMFALGVLHEFGCDGPTGTCGSVGRFTSDYWWFIDAMAAVLIALALLPIYRRLLKTVDVNQPEIGGISDAQRQPNPHHDRTNEFR